MVLLERLVILLIKFIYESFIRFYLIFSKKKGGTFGLFIGASIFSFIELLTLVVNIIIIVFNHYTERDLEQYELDKIDVVESAFEQIT